MLKGEKDCFGHYRSDRCRHIDCAMKMDCVGEAVKDLIRIVKNYVKVLEELERRGIVKWNEDGTFELIT